MLASCLERTTVHYLLAFRPPLSGWSSGYHRIAVTTTRAGAKLFYRHQYYVGLSEPAPTKQAPDAKEIEQVLQRSACYYPVIPLSVRLQARLIHSGRADVVRYLVSADTSSLTFAPATSDYAGRRPAGIDRRAELDYGICNFDTSGKPVSYFHAPLDQVLNSVDYAHALDRGFPHILEFRASPQIALTRIVLRDRATGNLGAADVISPTLVHQSTGRRMMGSFGSVVPASDSFCGDVYELSQATAKLPDFRQLDPIGSIYTSELDVPDQGFMNTTGLPGVTPRTNLFGIDYHASFWVRTPGTYRFRMASDDGAILQIDDRQVINLDGLHQVNESSGHVELGAGLHTMHVPYYQGAPISVALQLWVKPPGAKHWAIFDLKNYEPPSSGRDVQK